MYTRRPFALILAAGLTVSVVAATSSHADAGKKKKKKRIEHTEEATYATPALGIGGVETICVQEPAGCVSLPVEPTDRFVSLEISDQAGQPVYASVYVFGYTDGSDTHEHICGASNDPLFLTPGLEELVVVVATASNTVTGTCQGLATTGTVSGTFSNLP